jgi:hypothetical protein
MSDRYTIHEKVGKGAYGDVYRATHIATREPMAIKIIDLEYSEDDIEEVRKEISIMSELQSKYLTRLHESFAEGCKLYIVMEFLDGGSVRDLLDEMDEAFSEPLCAYMIHEVVLGLNYLHSNGKIHRDLKCDNLLMSSEGSVKLGDFGGTGRLTETEDKRNTFVGSPFWMAPEVIKENDYDTAADIWSLGVLAFELAKGQPPYSQLHPMRVLFLIPKNPAPVLEGSFSKPFKDFVGRCLNKDPKKRPSAAELLKHPFLNLNTNTLKKRRADLARVAAANKENAGETSICSSVEGEDGNDQGREDGAAAGGETDADGVEGLDRGPIARKKPEASRDDHGDGWDFSSVKVTRSTKKNYGMDSQASAMKFLSLRDQLTRARKGIGMAIQSDKKGNSLKVDDADHGANMPGTAASHGTGRRSDRDSASTWRPRSLYSASGTISSRGSHSSMPRNTILESVVKPSVEKLASSVDQRDPQFADVMGALAQLKSSFEMLEKCTANGLREGDLVHNLMASMFALAKNSNAKALKCLYENPSLSIELGDKENDFSANRKMLKVSQKLLSAWEDRTKDILSKGV